jgi:PGF-CTERM protein
MIVTRTGQIEMQRDRFVVVAAVAVVALAGVAGATAPGAEFEASQYEASQDGSATMTVALNDTDTAQLQVGSESVGYTLNATLVDENGDGAVAVEFVVPNAGTDDVTLVADSGTALRNVTESEFHDPPLAPGAYRLTVTATGDQPSDVARLTVEEPGQSTTDADLTTTYAPTDDDVAETTSAAGTTAPQSPETTTAPTTDDASNGGSPGFGVAAALVGLLAAALLAVRR